MPLKAVARNCSLTPSDTRSSTDLLLSQVLAALAGQGVTGEAVRATRRQVRAASRRSPGRQ